MEVDVSTAHYGKPAAKQAGSENKTATAVYFEMGDGKNGFCDRIGQNAPLSHTGSRWRVPGSEPGNGREHSKASPGRPKRRKPAPAGLGPGRADGYGDCRFMASARLLAESMVLKKMRLPVLLTSSCIGHSPRVTRHPARWPDAGCHLFQNSMSSLVSSIVLSVLLCFSRSSS